MVFFCDVTRIAVLLLVFAINVDAKVDKQQTDVGGAEETSDSSKSSKAEGKSIAVIGGGSAGAVTVLELLRREEVSEVTLIEQADRIGHPKSASGIIAALLITDPEAEYWNVMDDPHDVLEKVKWINVQKDANYERLVKFAQRAASYKVKKDPRVQKPHQTRWFKEGGKIVKELINWKPELCEAIIGPFCCEEGTLAAAWMQEQGAEKGLHCNYLHGVAHIFSTQDDFKIADNEKKAAKGHWDVWKHGSSELDIVEKYIQKNLSGAVWQDHHEGFVRVELLFPILTKIFKESGKVDLAMNCNVKGVKANQATGKVSVIIDEKLSPDCKLSRNFDKVIVAAGAGSVPLLSEVDQNLPWEMIPVKGFAIANSDDMVMEKNRMIGIEFEEPGQYIRAQADGGIRYGFGRVIGTFEDELLDPKFEHWESEYDPKFTGLGKEMLKLDHTHRLAGMRPVSAMGNFPIVKAFQGEYSGILLNTGFGFYGYGLTWNSAKVVVDVALHGHPLDDQWAYGVEYTTGTCPMYMPTCWPVWLYFGAIALGGLVLLAALYFICQRLCRSDYTKVAGDPPGGR